MMHTNIQKITILILLASLNILADSTGGAKCTNNIDCGDVNVGTCINIINGTGVCVCPSYLADPNCTYARISGKFVFSLQLLCLVGIGGVGNFVLGNTGIAVCQLLLTLPLLIIWVTLSIMLCTKSNHKTSIRTESTGCDCDVHIGPNPTTSGYIPFIGIKPATYDHNNFDRLESILNYPIIKCSCLVLVLWILAGIIWCLVDAVNIANAVVTDSNGYTTYFN